MTLFSTHATDRCFWADQSGALPTLARPQISWRSIAGLSALIARFARTDDAIAARYAGRGWTDSTERQLLDDASTRQCG